MAKKVRVIEQEIDFGEYTLIIILFNKPEQAQEILEEQYQFHFEKEEVGERTLGFVKQQEGLIAFCLHNSFTIPDLVHECFHLTYTMLSGIDIKLNDNTEEVYARHIDSMYRTITNLLKSHRVKLPNT